MKNNDAKEERKDAKENRKQAEKLALADAKDIVLPGMKRWLQSRQLGQFSDKALAEVLRPEDFPPEVGDLAKKLATFAGVQTEGDD